MDVACSSYDGAATYPSLRGSQVPNLPVRVSQRGDGGTSRAGYRPGNRTHILQPCERPSRRGLFSGGLVAIGGFRSGMVRSVLTHSLALVCDGAHANPERPLKY